MNPQQLNIAQPPLNVSNVNPPPRVYRGKPENQRDPAAQNAFKMRSPKPPGQNKGPQLPRPPPMLNAPTQLHSEKGIKMSTGNPAEGSVFGANIAVKETRLRTTFTPSAPAVIEISRQTYAEMITDDPQVSKALLPEYLDYYATAMLWLRIVHLKQRNSQVLTQQEQDLLTLTQTTNFCVPEPLTLQLQQLGNIQTITKQHLYPEFPPLPIHVLAGIPGYYGRITLPGDGADVSIHNLYEEIPCLGVLAEAVRQSISDAAPGPYQSNLDINPETRINANLLGYKPLGNRRSEAKNTAFACGIGPAAWPCYPANSGFNFEFLTAISNIVSTTHTFKNTEIVFSTMSEIGAQSQIVISRPIVSAGRTNLLGETRPTSLGQEASSTYGSAIFFDSQLMKEPGVANDNSTWCCVTIPGVFPAAWTRNRNARRNLPPQYMQETFQSVSQDAGTYRTQIIKQLVISKR